MPDSEEIAGQRQRLAIHRFTLAEYLKQQALLGVAYAPPGVANGIRLTRDNIKQINVTLRAWGAEVEDHPDDESSAQHTDAQQVQTAINNMANRASDDPLMHNKLTVFQSSFQAICQQIDSLS